jgi:hypothetical protein
VLQYSFSAVQFAHVAPDVPHIASALPGWQFPLASQQPLGQLVESHAHAPPFAALTPSCPVGHEMQAAPLAPHSVFVVPAIHDEPLQQPVGQLVASHWQTPPPEALAHSCPVGHTMQAAPFAPHSVFVGTVTHVVPLQHPVEQLFASQVHAPPFAPSTHS